MLAQNAGGDSHLSRQELSAAIYGLASMYLLVGDSEVATNGLRGSAASFPRSRLLDSSRKKAGELATGYRNGSDQSFCDSS
jgi:hypothetical protein